VLVHVINGDSPDPVGDFNAIQQELRLFNPDLALKTQVIVVNKIDLPHVRDGLNGLVSELRKAAGHSRVMAISAATTENVRELMGRVLRLVCAVREAELVQTTTDGTCWGRAAAGLELRAVCCGSCYELSSCTCWDVLNALK
jgi:GTPase involved in cell partitioning and DNA repair